jgi:hypothetical protein
VHQGVGDVEAVHDRGTPGVAGRARIMFLERAIDEACPFPEYADLE